MPDVIGLNDVSSKDTGKGSQLKTGNLKRSYNMPKECVNRLMKQGKSAEEANKLCYPKKSNPSTLPNQQGYKDLEYKSKMSGKKSSYQPASMPKGYKG